MTALWRLIFSIILITALPLFASAQNNTFVTDSTKISQLLYEQQDAWNNANMEAFMQVYWQSDSLMFLGKNGPTYGWQQTLDNYNKSYPDAQTMGILSFDIIYLKPLAEQTYLMVGKWHLQRTNDEPQGHFTLIWQKINQTWKIIYDHSS
ncbi:MAG: nuclear transport factor 2 family protein [Chitinophagales bacterium]|nr:nuclear transport factor 2 family protein [Bacteroidota bacterium]